MDQPALTYRNATVCTSWEDKGIMVKAPLGAKRLIKRGERQKSNGGLIKDRRLTKRGAQQFLRYQHKLA